MQGVVFLSLALATAIGLSGSELTLIDAARKHDLATVRNLLRQHVDVDQRQGDGATALHWAVQADDLAMADLLIGAGAHVDAVNDYGVMPLHQAATNGSAAMVERLLRAGASANATLPSGETILMTASRVGHIGPVRLLLAAGAAVNAREPRRGQTALMWAISEGHLEVAKALIGSGADLHARTTGGFTPLFFAAREGAQETARLLVSRGAGVNDVDKEGNSVLLVATVRGHADVAMYLLEQGADANADGAGYTPLHWAAGTWESLMTGDYSVEQGEWSRLGGVSDGRLELIHALLAHGANANARLTKSPPRFGHSFFRILGGGELTGGTPFFVAAMAGDVPVMQALLAAGADPALGPRDGTTPLIVAAGLGVVEEETRIPETRRLQALEMLLDLGADINAVNAAGNTALHAAAFVGFDAVARFLVQRGAFLNTKNKRGQTPLKVASGVELTLQLYKHPSTEALLRSVGATMD